MSALKPDYNKRDCSLPPGCKDLIDVLNLQSEQSGEAVSTNSGPPTGASVHTHAKTLHIQIGSYITVRELAALLERAPFQIVADLIELAIMATTNQMIQFEVAARVTAKYGFVAERTA